MQHNYPVDFRKIKVYQGANISSILAEKRETELCQKEKLDNKVIPWHPEKACVTF